MMEEKVCILVKYSVALRQQCSLSQAGNSRPVLYEYGTSKAKPEDFRFNVACRAVSTGAQYSEEIQPATPVHKSYRKNDYLTALLAGFTKQTSA